MNSILRFATAFGLFLFASAPTSAQVEKGLLETSFTIRISYSSYSYEYSDGYSNDQRRRSFDLSTRCAYFVSRRVDVGGILGLDYSNTSESDWYGASLGPTIAYHFRPDTKIVPFVGGAFGVVHGRGSSSSGLYEQKQTEMGWFGEASGGADFFFTRSVAMRLQLVYNRRDFEYDFTIDYPSMPPAITDTSNSVQYGDAALRLGLAIFLDTK